MIFARDCLYADKYVLATGDGAMVECQEAVLSMVPVVESMAVNAAMAFPSEALLQQLAKVYGEFCDYCAEACEPHAEHYAECKNCMDRCRECSDACAAYVKA